jgi:hypothetical protein
MPQDPFAQYAVSDDPFSAYAIQSMASHAQELETSGGATATAAAARALPAAGRLLGRFAADHPAATQKVIGAGVSTVAGGIGGAVGGVPGAVVGASIRGVTPTQAAIREGAGRLAGETPQIARNAGRAVAVANYATEAGLPLKPAQLVSTGDAASAIDHYAQSMGQRIPRVLDQYGKVVVGPEAAPVVKAGPRLIARTASGLARVLAPVSAATGITDFAQAVEPNRHDIGVAGLSFGTPRSDEERAEHPALLNLLASRIRTALAARMAGQEP